MAFSVLVVEDEKKWRSGLMDMYEDLLAEVDTQILPATTVAEGRRLLENMEWDLLSLDINLASGNMTGEGQSISGEGDGRTLIRLAEEEGVGGIVCITAIQHDDEIPFFTDDDPAVVRMTLPSRLDRLFPDRNRYIPKQESKPVEDQVNQIRGTLSESSLQKISGLQNVFYQQGDSWRVKFQGEETLVSDKTGMQTIHHLLKNEDQPVSASELDSLESPKEASGQTSSMSHRQREEEGLSTSPGEILDREEREHNRAQRETLKESLKEIEERIAEIDRKMEEIRGGSSADPAGITGDSDAHLYRLDKQRSDLEDDRERLKKSLAEYQKTKESKQRKRLKQRVQKRINRCVKHIKDAGHVSLAEHLDDSISTGKTCAYKPRESLSWFL